MAKPQEVDSRSEMAHAVVQRFVELTLLFCDLCEASRNKRGNVAERRRRNKALASLVGIGQDLVCCHRKIHGLTF